MTDHTSGGVGGGFTTAHGLGGPAPVPAAMAMPAVDWVSVVMQAIAFVESPAGQQLLKTIEEAFVAIRIVSTNTPHLLEPLLGAVVKRFTGHELAPVGSHLVPEGA
jgi:hypothetical protein